MKATETQQMLSEFCQAMDDFKVAMQCREALSVKIATRTTMIIRISLITIIILSGLMFYLVFTLASDMGHITAHTRDMLIEFKKVSVHTNTMQANMKTIDANIFSMPMLEQSVRKINSNMQTINSNMSSLNKNITHIQKNTQLLSPITHAMRNMNGEMTAINKQFHQLNNSIRHMDNNVRQMSKPLNYFPF